MDDKEKAKEEGCRESFSKAWQMLEQYGCDEEDFSEGHRIGYMNGFDAGVAYASSGGDKSPVHEAVDTLREALQADSDFYFGWQSNIAMAFVDESEHLDSLGLQATANEAAKRFLDSLLSTGDKNE